MCIDGNSFPLTCCCKNRYVVVDNYIHITEYVFGIKTLDISVNIAQIEKVVPIKSVLRSHSGIYYFVDGKRYTMGCTTHRKEVINIIKRRQQQ